MGALVLGVFAQERGEEGGQPNAFLFFFCGGENGVDCYCYF